MKRFLPVWALLAAILSAAQAQPVARTRYPSPDRALIAVVRPVAGGDESILEIRRRGGGLLCRKDMTSPHHDQGYAVNRAAWTPDGRFFVFNVRSSGGHSPWHIPTYFYSRRTKTIRSLDKLIGTVTTETLALRAPDILRTQIFDTTRRSNGADIPSLPRSVRLGRLDRNR